MNHSVITYQETGYFSRLIVDYLNQDPLVRPLYHHYPTFDNFSKQIQEKQMVFTPEQRIVLTTVLQNQNQKIELSNLSLEHLNLLKRTNTFTITTGHQLNLFTGPIYFIYKIISTINLCKDLKEKYPEYHFVPIYWMATEDHDFEEINHFTFKDKKIQWARNSKGPVGRLSTDGLEEVFEFFSNELGLGDTALYLKKIFEEAYLKNETLADATRCLVNALFKNEGLLIIDGDDIALKKSFAPIIKEELLLQTSHKTVLRTLAHFKYPVQVNPREINLFYIENDLRERIIYKDQRYLVNNTSIVFTTDEILDLVTTAPEKFSPNVILRPLYQELVLPNLCYIGGGGELAYWLELKAVFEHFCIPFPILCLRNSAVVATKKQANKINALHLNWAQLFLKQAQLIDSQTKELSLFKIDFYEQKDFLKKQFESLKEMALHTDPSFMGAVNAQEAKQIKGLEKLEKRLLKAQKRVLHDKLMRITELQDELFPAQSLQERTINFSELYLQQGENLFEKLLLNLKPLNPFFQIFTMND